ncbi:hypothetical protein D9758_006344 [Tetrapyrgos nigripes]|uniref:F-box domain-containing protein n=1 Tax=Tetrapyrgos nigripes TaxID=182062 RepID=A0A8H5G0J0_9AGAR|nr:hypothetical protein D9758_006344 [Tetrapyrgos nigripes]
MMEQTHFTSLPSDLLLVIFDWVSPLDIIHLRQTCKLLHELTVQRSVWASVYRNTSLFLPPGPHTLHPVSELERILVRAQRLDENWCLESGAPQLKTIRELTYEQDIRCMRLYRGRYLIVGFRYSFMLYDLERGSDWDQPIFQHDVEPQMGLEYRLRRHDSREGFQNDGHPEVGMYFAVFPRKKGHLRSHSIILWKIDPSQPVPISQVLSLPVEPSSVTTVVISNDYLVHWYTDDRKDRSFVYHIASKRLYHFEIPADEQQSWRPNDFIVLRDQVIAMHLHPRTKFECFAIPKQDETRTDDIRLERTHCGEWDVPIQEPQALVYRPPTSSTDEAKIVFASLMPLQRTVKLCLLEVILRQDGTISFNKIAEGNDTSSYFLSADICHRERFIRALSFEFSHVQPLQSLRLYDIDLNYQDQNGTPKIQERQLQLQSPHDLLGELAFDGYVGRICLGSENKVTVGDFV